MPSVTNCLISNVELNSFTHCRGRWFQTKRLYSAVRKGLIWYVTFHKVFVKCILIIVYSEILCVVMKSFPYRPIYVSVYPCLPTRDLSWTSQSSWSNISLHLLLRTTNRKPTSRSLQYVQSLILRDDSSPQNLFTPSISKYLSLSLSVKR